MSRTEITYDIESSSHIIRVWVEKSLTEDAIADAIHLAKAEIAKKIWEENADKIMAKMDLKGLAALIAVHASGALKK